MTLEEFRALCEDAAGEFRHLIPIPWNEDGFIANLSRCATANHLGFLPAHWGRPCGLYLGTGHAINCCCPATSAAATSVAM